MGSAGPPSKRITPSFPHEPSAPVVASQIVCGGAPETSTFFSFPSATKATWRLSGDQNGRYDAPSVPGAGRGSRDSSARIQICDLPLAPVAENATSFPSGEILGDSTT